MKIKYLYMTVVISALSVGTVYAEKNSNNMKMMNNKFLMSMESAVEMSKKASNEKNKNKKQVYMNKHMENMTEMMGTMGVMMSKKNKMMMKDMTGCAGIKGKEGMNNMSGDGNGMMMGGMKCQNDMMNNQMIMMHGMMEQMLIHMKQMVMR